MSAEYFEFRCGECGHQTTVNEAMRRELRDGGCVLCGEAVDPSDFSSS